MKQTINKQQVLLFSFSLILIVYFSTFVFLKEKYKLGIVSESNIDGDVNNTFQAIGILTLTENKSLPDVNNFFKKNLYIFTNQEKITDQLSESSIRQNLHLLWPVQNGVLFRGFDLSPERLHEGIALAAPLGTRILPAQAGEIVHAGDTGTRYGKIVIIKHFNQLLSIYAHLNEIFVHKNQYIKCQEYLGTVGVSGGLDSPRLYFQVRKNKIPIDPELLLK